MSNLPHDDGSTFDSLKQDTQNKKAVAAEELHERYHRLVYYFLRIFRLPYEHREDLFNQIFLKIITGLSTLKHADNLKSWVVTITKNEIFGYLNKRERENNLYQAPPGNGDGSHPRETRVSVEPTPEKHLYISQLRNTFEEAVERLDESMARPFLMRYRDNMRWKQIAKLLKLNEDTARKRADRAKDLIRDHFKKKFGPSSPMY